MPFYIYFRGLRSFRSAIVPILLGALLTAGCGTVPRRYIPGQVGEIPSNDQSSPIEVLIVPNQEIVARGEVLYFTVIIRNRAPHPIWIPRNPHVVLTWIYPNGDRDNFLREFPSLEFFSEQTAVLLQPGQQMNRTIAVKTYYFPVTGITEFRATLHCPENTNPALKPFFSGQVGSNAYGILVRKTRKRKSAASDAIISSVAVRGSHDGHFQPKPTIHERAGAQHSV